MKSLDRSINIVFKHSGEKADVSLAALTGAVIEFFDIYGTIMLAGKKFCSITGDGDGAKRFSNLLEKTGYSNDPEGFFTKILSTIVDGQMKNITVGGIKMPHLMLMVILEQVIPGHGYISIKDTRQLEKATHLAIPEKDRAKLQEV
ncbi:MAG: lysine 2,3-aminomutase, partial [Desulfobacula sp.]|nr:lysine 2,3-aminomutase [Desulfobacula sp.]